MDSDKKNLDFVSRGEFCFWLASKSGVLGLGVRVLALHLSCVWVGWNLTCNFLGPAVLPREISFSERSSLSE